MLAAPYRLNTLPDVPTLKEFGYPIPITGSSEGLLTSSKVPQERLAFLREVFKKCSDEKEVQEAFEKMGISATYLNGPEYEKSLEAELDVYKKVAKEADMFVK
jgi:tripartite-type tricarboxylate transporter receptor subunit TctC